MLLQLGTAYLPYRVKEMGKELRELVPQPADGSPSGPREFSFEDKRRLSMALGGLPGERLEKVGIPLSIERVCRGQLTSPVAQHFFQADNADLRTSLRSPCGVSKFSGNWRHCVQDWLCWCSSSCMVPRSHASADDAARNAPD